MEAETNNRGVKDFYFYLYDRTNTGSLNYKI